MSVDYDRIIAVAESHMQRAEPEEMAFRADVLELEENALFQASLFELMHTLAVSMGLLSEEERRDESMWANPQEIVAECTGRLAKGGEITAESFVSFLMMEYEFGVRVGMELGLELAQERQGKEQKT